MADVNALIQQGMAAVKAGNKAQARDILTKAVELDDQSEQGWLWLSACVDTIEEQQICLENVLELNPANEKARKGLAAIAKQAGQQSQQTSAKAAPTPSPKPQSAPTPSAVDPFAGSPFDAGGPDKADSPLGSGWDQFDVGNLDDSFLSGGQNSPAPASSVDWSPGGAPARGSGRDVPTPTADEYDNWVSGLSLGGNTGGSSAPSAPVPDDVFGSEPNDSSFGPASGPFGTSSNTTFSEDDFNTADPFGSPVAASANDDPFSDFNFDKLDQSGNAANPESDPFGPPADLSDPFGAGPFGSQSSQAPASPPKPATPSSSRAPVSGERSSASSGPFGGPSDPFSFSGPSDDSQDSAAESSDDIFAGVPGTPKRPESRSGLPKGGSRKTDTFGGLSKNDPFGGSGNDPFGASNSVFPDIEESPASKRKPAPSSGSFAFIDPMAKHGEEAYYKAIPPEIQADGSGQKADPRLLATVGLLVVLNVLSLAFLLVNLMQH